MSRTTLLVAGSLAAFLALPLVAASGVQLRPGSPSSPIEFEDLVGVARASAGQVTRQDMQGFGRGWSRNAQLFWSAPPPTDRPIRNWPHLSLWFNSTEGTHDVVLHYTSAPDFGTFRVFVDGEAATDIDAYSSSVAPQTRSLGRRRLAAGRHELIFTVFTKAPASRGFFVGLDCIELRPLGDIADTARAEPQRMPRLDPQRLPRPEPPPPPSEPQRRERGVRPMVAGAQLNFALIDGTTLDWTAKGGTETTFDHTNRNAHLVWQSSSDKVKWRWQVAVQPFSGAPDLSPPGLVAEQDVSSSRFAINFATFPPLNTNQPIASRDFYIRVIAMNAEQPVVSNVVVAHYVPGSDKSGEITKDAFTKAHEEKEKRDKMEAMAKAYKVEILSFEPPVFPDVERWGCVVILKNPNPLTPFRPGEHCPARWSGQGQHLTFWDYVTGWVKAYEVAASFYQDAKGWVATQFASALPCEQLGKAAAECEKYAAQAAGIGMTVGLAAAGVPPTLPDFSTMAKGKAVDAGVNFTCMSIESNGGKCSPELRTALGKAYSAGLDKLSRSLDKTMREPGCGNEAVAHEHGREPLPCFGDMPGVEFKPARGAIYEAPMVRARITRVGPGLPEAGELELRADLTLSNHFPGGTIETYYQPVPPTDLSGELFAPARLRMPPLAMGQSVELSVPLGGIKQFTFSSTKNMKGENNGYAVHNGWCALYKGGHGPLNVRVVCDRRGGGVINCSDSAVRTVQLPNDHDCAM